MDIWGSFVRLLEYILLTFRDWTGSSGLAIILFTILARLVILPLTLRSIQSSRRMQEIQPQLKELQRKYGKDQQKLTQETMKLYKDYKINPAGGCLPLFIQLPIFLAVYQAVINLTRVPVSESAAQTMLTVLGQAGANVTGLGATLGQNLLGGGFLWIAELGKPDNLYILPVLSVVFQLIVQLMATPRVQDPQQKAMMQSMLLLPVVFGYIGFVFPAGAVLYWVVGSILSMVQQVVVSGWGSLANYLKFLPADFNGFLPSHTPVAATASAAVPVNSPATPAPDAANKLSFWDVLRPLTEQGELATVDATEEDAPEASSVRRRPVSPNARRRRPRRT